MAIGEEFLRGANVVGAVEEFIVSQGVVDGVEENPDIGSEVCGVGIRLEGGEFGAEIFDLFFKLGTIGIRNGEAGRWNRSDFVGDVVSRTIGASDSDGDDEKKHSENHEGRM